MGSRRWQDWRTSCLALALRITLALGYDGIAAWNAHGVGVGVSGSRSPQLTCRKRGKRSSTLLFGVWLVVSPLFSVFAATEVALHTVVVASSQPRSRSGRCPNDKSSTSAGAASQTRMISTV